MSEPLESYGLIGDCETAALVSRAGSIDWLCWPRFDSGACFASLLGGPEHGRWLIETVERAPRVSRRYRHNTLILETRMETAAGAVTLVDFMPPRVKGSKLVRLIRGERGRVRMRMELVLRFDYGRTIPWVTRRSDTALQAIAGPDLVLLQTQVPVAGKDLTTVGEFDIDAGETAAFVLSHGPSHEPPPDSIDPIQELRCTEAFWTEWASRNTSTGEWSDVVMRSLITLKALTYAPTGGMVAAPTTSVPEWLGGVRNWDYRYCWLRDATFTLLSLMNAGYYDEAGAWRDWLLRAAAGAPDQVQIMYGLAGERRLTEFDIPWLPGYEGSRPVRVGNAAHHQLQLDVYGEVIDALHQGRRGRLRPEPADWAFQRAVIEHVESIWKQPDAGIWEVRGDLKHFTYSKVMAWVALDRGIRATEDCGLDGPTARWRSVRDAIHTEICERAFNRTLGSFVQSYDSNEVDASLLLLHAVGFLPATDERIRSTISTIERHLLIDGFVARYDTHKTDDGLPPGEGTFLACSFWLADAYAATGRVRESRDLFERLIALANDVGLLAEEYDPKARRLLGNFPQAFSHISLVDTAHNLARVTKPNEQRSA